LMDLPNVLLTPQIGGATEEAEETINEDMIHKIWDFLETGSTKGCINLPEISVPMENNGVYRLTNIHKNQPGALEAISKVLVEMNANVTSQFLRTKGPVGYLIMEVESEIPITQEKFQEQKLLYRTRTWDKRS